MPGLRNVAPLTEKGREEEVEEVTGGGGPPRELVNVWVLLLEGFDGAADEEDGEVDLRLGLDDVAEVVLLE